MRNLQILLCSLGIALLSVGCATEGSALAGTYRSESGLREIILNSDGSFRMMNGERTSPSDLVGTYRQERGKLVFTAESGSKKVAPAPAELSNGGFTLGTEQYKKS